MSHAAVSPLYSTLLSDASGEGSTYSPRALMLFCALCEFDCAAGHHGEHKDRTHFQLSVSSLHTASLLLTVVEESQLVASTLP